MAKVTGIGGVFFKSSSDHQKLAEILKGPESHENGQFAWILDPDGNKVELWQPMLWSEANR
jgi:predicted enzyme related to lactoylglutathione lyase